MLKNQKNFQHNIMTLVKKCGIIKFFTSLKFNLYIYTVTSLYVAIVLFYYSIINYNQNNRNNNSILNNNVFYSKNERLDYLKTFLEKNNFLNRKSLNNKNAFISKEQFSRKKAIKKFKRKLYQSPNNINENIMIEFPSSSNTAYSLNNYSLTYNSQVMQDRILLQLLNIKQLENLKHNGFFIEAGAYDGQTISNTLHLERFKNWTGLLVEPSKENYNLLKKVNRKSYTINCCLTANNTSLYKTYAEAGPFSIITTDTTDSDTKSDKSKIIICHSLNKILKKLFKLINFNRKIDYLSLDIEGSEKEMIEAFDWQKYEISLLNIEYNQNKTLYNWIKNYLGNYGYIETFVDDVYYQEIYLAHKSIYHKLNLTHLILSEFLKLNIYL